MENGDRFGREEIDRTFEAARCPNCGFAPSLHAGSTVNRHDDQHATLGPRDAEGRCPICDENIRPPVPRSRTSSQTASGIDLAWEGWLEQRRVERWLWFLFAGGLCCAAILFFWRH
ncbi:hypothetical protein OAL71_01905 [Phycisphaerales bacterium]|nr:hypothetical protein [Phycisphaerales bacterium]RPG15386.1 MAG: hypothetical protein CBB69_009785 [Phycisphaera sp. TMED9]